MDRLANPLISLYALSALSGALAPADSKSPCWAAMDAKEERKEGWYTVNTANQVKQIYYIR